MSSRSGKTKASAAKRSRSARAGVTFPVGRLTRVMRRHFAGQRLGTAAPVYMAAVLEYLTAEILELAGEKAKLSKRKRLKPQDIKKAIVADLELSAMLSRVIFSQGGVVPELHDLTSLNNQKDMKLKQKKTERAKLTKKTQKQKKTFSSIKKIKATVKSGSKSSAASIESSKLPVLSEKLLFLGQKLSVVMGDITLVSAECLIHPTSASYATSGQVGQVLASVGGHQFDAAIAALRGQGSLTMCGAVMSEMFNTEAKKVIHCNSPSWSKTSGVADLEKTIQNCLKLADKENLKSIAFPSVGSGNAGWPKQLAAETILRAINQYFQMVMASSIKQVYFVLYDNESVMVYTTELQRLMDRLTDDA